MAVSGIPVGRAPPAAVSAGRVAVLSHESLVSCIDAMPCMVMVLNEQRQILVVNEQLLKALDVRDASTLVGRRPGEVVGCLHAHQGTDGCGSSDACAMCGAAEAVVVSQRDRFRIRRDTRLMIGAEAGRALDLEVTASPFDLDGRRLTLVALRDIADEKRRRALERVFFHDVLNTASGINSVARLVVGDLGDEQKREFEGLLANLSEQMVEEIRSYATIALAEDGELKPERAPVPIAGLLAQVQALYAHHPAAQGRSLRIGGCVDAPLVSDAVLIRRILGNLVKNAFEATAAGGTVTLTARIAGLDSVAFEVHNPGVISHEVQLQLFQRSFSTKGVGRGLGTYSVRLLAERYLGGRVSFACSPKAGTVMTVVLPLSPPSR